MSFDPLLITDAVGAQSQVDIFLLRLKSDKSGYDFLDPAAIFTSPTFPASPSLPVLNTPTRDTALVYSLQLLVDHKADLTDKGLANFTFDSYDNSKYLNDRLVPLATPSGSSSSRTRPAYTLENTVVKGGTAQQKTVMTIIYESLDQVVSEVATNAHIGTLTLKTFGGGKDEDYAKVEFGFTGLAPEANITIPAAIYDPTKVTVSSPQTLYKLGLFLRKYFPAGAGAI